MPAYRVTIKSLSVSDDGRETLIAADAMDGEPVDLVFSADELDRLLAAIAHATTLAVQRRLDDPSVVKLLPVTKWQVRSHAQTGVILTMRLVNDLHRTG